MGTFVQKVWDGHSAWHRLVAGLLRPFSALFSVAARRRARAYASGRLVSARVEVPVVSVGNLSVGGTGKTPFVLWLVEQLLRKGLRPVVLSRGYGGTAKEPLAILPSDHKGGAVADVAADEALLVAARSGCPVVTCPDRIAAARLAIASFQPDLLILDDGFQHLALRRDLDIVLLAPGDTAQRTLPAGPLREDVSALDRADVIILTGAEEGEVGAGGSASSDGRGLGGADSASGVPFGEAARGSMRVVPLALVEIVAPDALKTPVSDLATASVTAVAGIARPERFFRALERAGAQVRARLIYRDHHRYQRSDWEEIEALGAAADFVVTTEKDLVKLQRFEPPPGRLKAVRIAAQVDGGDDIVERVSALVRAPSGV